MAAAPRFFPWPRTTRPFWNGRWAERWGRARPNWWTAGRRNSGRASATPIGRAWWRRGKRFNACTCTGDGIMDDQALIRDLRSQAIDDDLGAVVCRPQSRADEYFRLALRV